MGNKQNILVTVDALIFGLAGNEAPSILLIERKNEPFKGRWAIPGGFVENNEPLEKAAKRELEEETGVKIEELIQLRAFGDPERDPRGRIISVVYYGILNKDETEIKASTDAAKASWFHLDDLPDMAFDHEQIFETAIDKIKQELLYIPSSRGYLQETFDPGNLFTLKSYLEID